MVDQAGLAPEVEKLRLRLKETENEVEILRRRRRLASNELAFLASTPTSAAAGHIIQDEGVTIFPRSYLNFVGAGVTATDVGGKSTITISNGGGTLDDAYDFGGAGAGRTINVDANLPVLLSAPASTDEVLDVRVSGDAFPRVEVRPDGRVIVSSFVHGRQQSERVIVKAGPRWLLVHRAWFHADGRLARETDYSTAEQISVVIDKGIGGGAESAVEYLGHEPLALRITQRTGANN